MPGSQSKEVNPYLEPKTPNVSKRMVPRYEQLSDDSPTSPPVEAGKRTRKPVVIDGHLVFLNEGARKRVPVVPTNDGDDPGVADGELGLADATDGQLAGEAVGQADEEVEIVDQIEAKPAYVSLLVRKAGHVGGGFDSESTMLSKAMTTYAQFDPINANPIKFKVSDVVPYVSKLPGACSTYAKAELLDLEYRSSALIHEALQVEHSLDIRRIKDRFIEIQASRAKVPMVHRVYRAAFHWP